MKDKPIKCEKVFCIEQCHHWVCLCFQIYARKSMNCTTLFKGCVAVDGRSEGSWIKFLY